MEKEGLDRGTGTDYRAAGWQTRWRVGADNGDCGILVGCEAADHEGGVMHIMKEWAIDLSDHILN